MTKVELIDAIAKGTGLKKSEAGKALDAIIETIESELKKGGDVRLVGFGTFSVRKRAARNGRNPQTGKAIKIAARKAPAFKAGKTFKEAIA